MAILDLLGFEDYITILLEEPLFPYTINEAIDASDPEFDGLDEQHAAILFRDMMKARGHPDAVIKAEEPLFLQNFRNRKPQGRVHDKRYGDVKSRYRVLDDLKDIATIRRICNRFGLDLQFKQAIQNAVGPDRYEDLMKYGDPDSAKQEAQRESDPAKRKEKQAELEQRGRPTLKEITLMKYALQKEVRPKIEAHKEGFTRLRSDPKIRQLLDGVDFDTDIEVHFADALDGNKPRKEKLLASDSLTDRIKQFGEYLRRTDTVTARALGKMFKSTYDGFRSKLESTNFLGGKDPESQAQRTYTAAQYALHKVAPMLNMGDWTKKTKHVQTHFKTKREEAARVQAEREKQLKRAAKAAQAAAKKPTGDVDPAAAI